MQAAAAASSQHHMNPPTLGQPTSSSAFPNLGSRSARGPSSSVSPSNNPINAIPGMAGLMLPPQSGSASNARALQKQKEAQRKARQEQAMQKEKEAKAAIPDESLFAPPVRLSAPAASDSDQNSIASILGDYKLTANLLGRGGSSVESNGGVVGAGAVGIDYLPPTPAAPPPRSGL